MRLKPQRVDPTTLCAYVYYLVKVVRYHTIL